MFYVFLTIFLAVYCQLIFRWRLPILADIHPGKIGLILHAFVDPYVLSAYLVGGLVGGVCWMIAISTIPISFAFPFMSLTYPLVLLGAKLIYGENVGILKWVGILLIMGGIILIGVGKR